MKKSGFADNSSVEVLTLSYIDTVLYGKLKPAAASMGGS